MGRRLQKGGKRILMYNITGSNVLIKNIKYTHNSNVDAYLLNYLDPYEFYAYTYLVNAPEGYTPNYPNLKAVLRVKSTTTVYNVVNRLKSLGLLHIERLDGNVFVWEVRDSISKEAATSPEMIKVKKIIDNKDSRVKIMKEIAALEDSLDLLPVENITETLEKITKLKLKLKGLEKGKEE